MKPRIKLFGNRWLWFSLVVLGYLLLIATDAIPYLRGPSVPQWRWLYDFEFAMERLWPAGLAGALAVGFLVIVGRLSPERLNRRREAGLLAALVLLALLIQAAVLFVERENVPALLFDRVVSPTANGYFTVAVPVSDVGQMLRTFPTQMKAFPYQHPSTHPPGLVLAYLAALRVMERLPALAEPLGMWARTFRCADMGLMALSNAQLATAALLALLKPALSTLTLLPLYGIGRRLYGIKGALRSGLFYTLVPAVSLFATTPDQLYPFFACLTIYWLMLAVKDRRWGYALLAGLALSVASFMSAVNVMVLALPAIYFGLRLTLALDRDHFPRRHLFLCAAAFFVGLVSVWVAYQAAFSVSPFEILDAATHDLKIPPLPPNPTLADYVGQIAARLREVNGGRSYLIWVFYNLYDYFAFLGLPLLALLGPAVLGAIQKLRPRRLTAAETLPLAFVLTLLALDFSGIIRGEVGRIWLFLMPFGVLATVGALPDENPPPLWLVAGLQLAQTVVFAMSLTLIDPVLWPMPSHERSFAPPAAQHPLELEFGGGVIQLLGYDLESPVTPGDSVNLTLYWQSVTQTPVSYKVFVHLLDPADNIRGQKDNPPLSGDWPTTCWTPGEVVADPYVVSVPLDAPSGDYSLAVGLYQEATRMRLPIGNEDHVRLGPVVVSTSP